MKKLMIVFMALVCATSFAQTDDTKKREHKKEMRQKRPDLSPEQMATLATKEMTLHLDLTDEQKKEISKLNLERAKKRKERQLNKKKGTRLSDAERYEMKTKRLDEQIATKKQLKTILTEAQYEKLEEKHSSKTRRARSHHRKHRASGDRH